MLNLLLWLRDPWAKENEIKTPASPYFKNFLELRKVQKTKRLAWYFKKDSFIPKEFYSYDKDTPFLTNKELKNKYLTKTVLTDSETKELFNFLEKRRHLMDQHSKYHFTRVYYEFIENLEFKRFSSKYPHLGKVWLSLKNKVNYYKNAGSNDWENWKEKMGYFSQRDMLAMADYEAIRRDMIDNIWHEKHQSNTLDRIWGAKAERILPLLDNPELLENKVSQIPLRNYILKIKRSIRNNKMLAREPMWQYHNPWEKRLRYIFPINEFIYEYHRHMHMYFVKFQTEAPLILEEIIKLKKVKMHERRVKNSWKYILDKKVPLTEKFLKFLQGDIWLQSRINFEEFFGFSWGSEYDKHKKGQSDVYNQAAWAGRFNFYGEHSVDSTNPWLSRFHKLYYRDHWSWGIPIWYGNSFYLEEYFKPWLRFLKKTKVSPYGTIDNPDIFWFKFSHKELVYLRRADQNSVDPRKFDSGANFRKVHKIISRLWNNAILQEPSKTKYRFYTKFPDSKIVRLTLPKDCLPEYIWVKYYTYDGPNFWWNYKQFKITKSVYFGPLNLPTSLRYKTLHEEFYLREFWYLLYNLWLPGISKSKIFYFNPYFLIFIYIIFIFLFFFYFFFAIKAPTREVRWTFQWKKPIWITRKFRKTGGYISQVEEWEPVRSAFFRHDFNYWFCLSFFPIFLFSVFLPFFFIRLNIYKWVHFLTWLIFLGSFSIVYMGIQYLEHLVYSFDDWINSKISPEEYRKIWAEERRLTHLAEKRFLRKLARKQKAHGVTYNPDHIDLY